jgi:hypothetical protein
MLRLFQALLGFCSWQKLMSFYTIPSTAGKGLQAENLYTYPLLGYTLVAPPLLFSQLENSKVKCL